jgi:hypothetical protein
MFNVPEVCRRAEETEVKMPQLKAKLSTKKQSSPLSQLRKLASSAKKKKKPTGSPGTGEEIPPPDFPLANSNYPNDTPIAPPPTVFTLTSLSTAGEIAGEEHVPTVSQATTHLALLEAFWSYKERFLAPDDDVKAFFGAVLGLPADKTWNKEDTEVLWKLVVEIAVGRFEAWWKIVGREMEAAKWDEQKTAGGNRWGPGDGPSKKVTELPSEMLPPLGRSIESVIEQSALTEAEVLMVWHSFMLNPKCYYDDCFALGVPSMLSVAFPWEAIVSSARNCFRSCKMTDRRLLEKRNRPVNTIVQAILRSRRILQSLNLPEPRPILPAQGCVDFDPASSAPRDFMPLLRKRARNLHHPFRHTDRVA